MTEKIQRTLVLVKPSGVKRGLVGEILSRYERKDLRLIGMKLFCMSRETAERFYEVHREMKFFQDLVSVMTAGPLVAIVLEGKDAIEVVRRLNGATNPVNAYPGTIRGDFALDLADNVVHASDSSETARREIRSLFGSRELVTTKRDELVA